jgi:hypothetical protein
MKRLTRNLPLLGVMAVAATAGGISLGHSAVSEINPLYYDTVQDRFHANLAALRPDWTAPQPAPVTNASTIQGLGSGCLGCSAQPTAEYYVAPAVVTYTDRWRADAEQASTPVEPAVVDEIAPDPERERIIRYASYPLTQEQMPAEPAQAPEPEAYAAVAVEVQ